IPIPDTSRSCHPLGHVLHRATTPGFIHRPLYVLRASPRICWCCLRDAPLAYPPPQWIILVYSSQSWCRTCNPSISISSQLHYLVLLSFDTAVYQNNQSIPVTQLMTRMGASNVPVSELNRSIAPRSPLT